ncbi:MAG TPA: protein kinase [Polyangia bacterium]|nr:protein kinase [Polyangia bacterium]
MNDKETGRDGMPVAKSDESAPTITGNPKVETIPSSWTGWLGNETHEQQRSVVSDVPAPKLKPLTPEPSAPTMPPAPTVEPTMGQSADAVVSLKPGTKISQYELIREIGSGGMGTVYLARDLRLGRRVAIKFLQSKDSDTTRRFLLEARATATCSHENIVIIYEVGEYLGNPFMVLEYLQGNPLGKVAKPDQPLPPARAVELMMPVVRALVCAHEQGIVHRDLKPDNVFVTDSGTVKVLDFGIAKVLQGGGEEATPKAGANEGTLNLKDAAGDVTRAGAVIGTLKYMSPEQWNIGLPIDHQTDIWACGVMLFQMLAGRHPLPPDSPPVLTALLQQPMTKLRDVAPSVPRALADVVDKCLMKQKSERFADAKSLLRALEPFQPGHITREIQGDVSPYAGLSSFQEEDAARFFGRTREIAAMVTRIRDRPLMGVIGPSGVGKSSLVRAGLVPALKQSGEAWEIHVLRPGRQPLVALAGVLAPLLADISGEAVTGDPKELAQKLRSEPGYLGTVLRRHARKEKRHVLLFIDQFEELYTQVPEPSERLAFTACMAGVADDVTSPTRVITSVRSDFLDRVSEDSQFMSELSQGLFFIAAPNREGLRAALVQPAEMAGYHFENADIVENMLEHLEATDSALPLLQFAATKLWEARDPARKLLTIDSYKALGGIAGALASHADTVITQLSPQARTLARTLLLRLVTSDRTRAIVTLDELFELSRDRGEVQRLVNHLVDARLLTVTTGDGGVGTTVEIVHESLIHSWPALHRWLEESQEDSAFLEQLRTAAKQWQGKGRNADLLWRGEMVEEAAKFAKRYRGELAMLQRDFLKGVFELDARAARRKRQLAIGGGMFLALLLFSAVVALLIIRDSQQRAERAAVAALSAEAEAKQRLAEVQAKELERQRAEAAKKEAEAATVKANTQVEMTNEELQQKNAELQVSLQNTEKQKRSAEEAQVKAEESAKIAMAAEEAAQTEKKRTEALLKKEQERVKRLEGQLGSAVVDELK